MGHADDARDRRDVADEVEIELLVERRVDRVRRRHQIKHVAVGRRAHDHLGADIGAGARLVLDIELLTEPLRQPLGDQARGDVDSAAGGCADDNPHRPRRIGLPPSEVCRGRHGGSARRQVEKFAPCKFHF